MFVICNLLFAISIPQSTAQEDSPTPSLVTIDGCRNETTARLSQQRRIERQVLFGRQPAEDMTANSVRYDEDGNPWMKMPGDIWRSAVDAFAQTSWTNTQVNEQTEWEGMNEIDPKSERAQRAGIISRTGVSTSELLPDILQMNRAFLCRLAMVCQGIRASFAGQAPDADGLLRITTPGCREMRMAPMHQCAFANGDAQQQAEDRNVAVGADLTAIETECRSIAGQLAEREAAFLRIAVSYDAAYRSLLQFAGNMDQFLSGMRGDVLAPLREALPLLSAFSRIPCFASECNE